MNTCVFCGTEVFYEPAELPTREGQIATELGMREFLISGFDEFCYDNLMIVGIEED